MSVFKRSPSVSFKQASKAFRAKLPGTKLTAGNELLASLLGAKKGFSNLSAEVAANPDRAFELDFDAGSAYAENHQIGVPLLTLVRHAHDALTDAATPSEETLSAIAGELDTYRYDRLTVRIRNACDIAFDFCADLDAVDGLSTDISYLGNGEYQATIVLEADDSKSVIFEDDHATAATWVSYGAAGLADLILDFINDEATPDEWIDNEIPVEIEALRSMVDPLWESPCYLNNIGIEIYGEWTLFTKDGSDRNLLQVFRTKREVKELLLDPEFIHLTQMGDARVFDRVERTLGESVFFGVDYQS